jgi:hypothetical protein
VFAVAAQFLNEQGLGRALTGLWNRITTALGGKASAADLATESLRAQAAEGANATAIASEASTRAAADQQIWLLIPANATAINQLATQAFVNSSIENMSANRVRYNAANDDFPTKAAFNNAVATGTFYFQGAAYTPKKNDYAGVIADETQGGHYTRYGFDGALWGLQSILNNTSFTQAQLDAVNSGITAVLLSTVQSNITTLQQNALTYTAPTSGPLANLSLTNALVYINQLLSGQHKDITLDVNTVIVPLT